MTQYSGKVIRKTPVTPTQTSASGVWKLADQAAAIRNNSWPVPGVPDPISRSVRLRSSASAYFSRTPAVAGSQTTWTMSFWVKFSASSAGYILGVPGTVAPRMQFYYYGMSDGRLEWYQNNGSSVDVFWLLPTQVFRDPSAWYHMVIVADTTQATSSNRLKWYVNGQQITAFTTATYPPQNTNTEWNAAAIHNIGRFPTGASYFDGYLTEINFIDGQALTPSSFGTTDTATGAWIPMPYTGTYGANGFYLNFKDNTDTTTIGYDYSGNANNWTANNISLTAGSTYDSMLDVPTPWVGYSTGDGVSVTRGNYCTLNAVSAGRTLSECNLNYAGSSTGIVKGTIGVSSGKWYWEVTAGNGSPVSNSAIGLCDINLDPTTSWLGITSNSWAYAGSALKYNNGSGTAYGAYYAAGDIIGVAFDADAGTLTFYKNNVSQGQAYSGITGSVYCPAAGNNTLNDYNGYHNFGQRPFTYSPPNGYKALCTTNLPTPTITNGANYMAASTYTGNGTSQNVVNSGNNTAAISFQPDFVWIKSRSQVADNGLFDRVRGEPYALLSSNTTAAESTGASYISSYGGLTSNGFQVNNNTSGNNSGSTYVGWQWKAGGAGSSNTSGSITSTVSVNTTAGFSIVTYTGTGSVSTVGHGLGVAPSMIIVKKRSGVTDWPVYHKSLGAASYVLLDLTNASAGSSPWNSVAPTSSVFTINSATTVNQSTSTYVAYCWAAVAGYSAFGSYTGNGSTDGPFVYLGFRPRWILIKDITAGGNWIIADTSRNTYNTVNNYLYPNLSDAEFSSSNTFDILSNGLKIRTASSGFNTSSDTYIYAAFAENPFKYSNAR